MIGIRFAPDRIPPGATSSELWIEDYELEPWVRGGQVTPDTLIWAGELSGNQWKRAEDLELYHLFRAETEPPPRPEPALKTRILPSRGFSGVEILVLANLVVAAALLASWHDNYTVELWSTMARWRLAITSPWDFYRIIPPLFIHADAGHLFRNMIGLVAAGAAVEVFFGRGRTILAYFITGIAGGFASFFGHGAPPLSVGASGAIFGLAGVVVAFLIRYYRRFTDRQRWKTRRVYAPLVVLLVAPSLVQADYFAHIAGFFAGVLLGLVLPLDEEGRQVLGPGPVPQAQDEAGRAGEGPEKLGPAAR